MADFRRFFRYVKRARNAPRDFYGTLRRVFEP
jgi:hypothetical protein